MPEFVVLYATTGVAYKLVEAEDLHDAYAQAGDMLRSNFEGTEFPEHEEWEVVDVLEAYER